MSKENNIQENKAIINRLSRVIGHLEYVKGMLEAGDNCSDILIQLSACKNAINNCGKVILKDHIRHSIDETIKTGDMSNLEKFDKAIDTFVK